MIVDLVKKQLPENEKKIAVRFMFMSPTILRYRNPDGIEFDVPEYTGNEIDVMRNITEYMVVHNQKNKEIELANGFFIINLPDKLEVKYIGVVNPKDLNVIDA